MALSLEKKLLGANGFEEGSSGVLRLGYVRVGGGMVGIAHCERRLVSLRRNVMSRETWIFCL